MNELDQIKSDLASMQSVLDEVNAADKKYAEISTAISAKRYRLWEHHDSLAKKIKYASHRIVEIVTNH
jgi:hypothetical protein